MATNIGIAPHEAFELHEILTFKNVCATKAAAMASMVQDSELRTMLENDFTTTQGHIKELQTLMQQSEFAGNTKNQQTQMNQGRSESKPGGTCQH